MNAACSGLNEARPKDGPSIRVQLTTLRRQGRRKQPKSLSLQPGSQQTTNWSGADSNAACSGLNEARPKDGPSIRVQLTTLRRQGRRKQPKSLSLQLGSQQMNPDELTQVSDSGDKSAGSRFERCLQRPQRARPKDGPSIRVQRTTLRRQGRRKQPKSLSLQLGSQQMNPDELTQVSDSGDKSAGSRFERCLQRPQRGEAQGWAEYPSAANNAAASRTKDVARLKHLSR
ncbi:Uncharacterised protein [Yersinia intermedia]|nr:Uncharacterised protein [Yersinia intermedia]